MLYEVITALVNLVFLRQALSGWGVLHTSLAIGVMLGAIAMTTAPAATLMVIRRVTSYNVCYTKLLRPTHFTPGLQNGYFAAQLFDDRIAERCRFENDTGVGIGRIVARATQSIV